MSEKNLVGLELELIVLDDSGKIVNRADEIINHPSNTGNILKESTLGVVEVISEPSSSLNELESLFTGELSQLQSITDSLGMYTAPISELGPQDALARREGSSRYSFSAAVLGTDNIGKLNSICGTHIHLDKEDNAVAQYNLMQSLDPVFVFLSTSPFLRGKNSFNSCRVQASRNEAFDAFPLHGQLLDYIPSLDYLDELNDLRLSTWMGGTSDPVQENIFDKYNTCWGPIRLRENTIEMRASDANSFSIVMAMAALYKGVNSYVFGKEMDVRISDKDKSYDISGSEITLPSYSTLKHIESEGIVHGLKSNDVHNYLSYLVDTADSGLPDSEKHHLAPFKEMLASNRNMSDVLYGYAKKTDSRVNGVIAPETANKVNLFMRDLYKLDLGNKQDTLAAIKEA